MSELMLRAGHNDHRVVQELLTSSGAIPPRRARLIRRVVVDATAATRTDVFKQAARESGTQLLIDPMTSLLTTEQAPRDSWAQLPFASPSPVSTTELQDPARRSRLIAETVEFQLDAGATGVVAPYVHLNSLDSSLVELQLTLVTDTADFLAGRGLRLEVMPVVSADLSAVDLDATPWGHGMGKLLRGAARGGGLPVALGLSSTGHVRGDTLHQMSRIWRRTATITPFIAWHCGDVGLLAVALGAVGYEAGMCTAERYDAPSQQRNRLPGNAQPGPRYTGVYVDSLGRSLSKSAVVGLSGVRGVRGDLTCFDSTCCPRGAHSLTGTGRRQHAVRSRVTELEQLDGIVAPGWKLHHLARRAAGAEAAAERIRHAATAAGIRVGAYPREYAAMRDVCLGLRETSRSAIA